MYGVAEEYNTVKEEDGPEDVDLEGLEAGADDPHEEDESYSFPNLYLSHGPDKWFFRVGDHFVENEDLFVFGKVIFGFFLDEVLGGEVADDELKNVEEDEVGDNVVGEAADTFEVEQDEESSGEPAGLFVEDGFVDKGVVVLSCPANGLRR